MTDRLSVEIFLKEFHQKLKIFEIRFRDDRGKNLQTLLNLEISPAFRRSVIESLRVEEYAEGPITDRLHHGAPLWVFGRIIKQKEVYIKISIGEANRPVICISFHEAEHPMTYPFK